MAEKCFFPDFFNPFKYFKQHNVLDRKTPAVFNCPNVS